MISRIGLFLRSLDNDYQQRLRDDAIAASGRLGFKVEVFAAQNDSARQIAQINKALSRPDATDLAAVLVSPVRDDVLADVARTTSRAGVSWVLLNREAEYVDTLREEFHALPIFGVTPDQIQIGRIQGQQMKVLLKQGGTVVYVTGPANTSSARRRLEGMRAEIEGTSLAVTQVEADWSSEGARMAVERWLESQDPNGSTPALFCAQNDEMALGVRQALRDAATRRNRPEMAALPITGCDGSPTFGQRLIREKRLLATVALPSAAGPALEWIARVRDGAQRPPGVVVLPVLSLPELTELGRMRA